MNTRAFHEGYMAKEAVGGALGAAARSGLGRLFGYLKDPAGKGLAQRAAQTQKELAKRHQVADDLSYQAHLDRAQHSMARKAADVTAPPTFSGRAAGKNRELLHGDYSDLIQGLRPRGWQHHVRMEPHASDVLRLLSAQRRSLALTKDQAKNLTNVPKSLEKGISRGTARESRLQQRLAEFPARASEAAAQSRRSSTAADAARKATTAASQRAAQAARDLEARTRLNRNLKRTAVGGTAVGGAAALSPQAKKLFR